MFSGGLGFSPPSPVSSMSPSATRTSAALSSSIASTSLIKNAGISPTKKQVTVKLKCSSGHYTHSDPNENEKERCNAQHTTMMKWPP